MITHEMRTRSGYLLVYAAGCFILGIAFVAVHDYGFGMLGIVGGTVGILGAWRARRRERLDEHRRYVR